MNNFILPTGRTVSKEATHCVAVKCNGRWSTKFYKSYRGASNELTYLRKCSTTTRAYYGIESYQLITPN
jgi:hypothetical protein